MIFGCAPPGKAVRICPEDVFRKVRPEIETGFSGIENWKGDSKQNLNERPTLAQNNSILILFFWLWEEDQHNNALFLGIDYHWKFDQSLYVC